MSHRLFVRSLHRTSQIALSHRDVCTKAGKSEEVPRRRKMGDRESCHTHRGSDLTGLSTVTRPEQIGRT